MANFLSDALKQQVTALGHLGWTLRRIEAATGVRRETASAYPKAAGLALRPPGRWGHPPANPATARCRTGVPISISSRPTAASGPTATAPATPWPGAASPTTPHQEAHLSLRPSRRAHGRYPGRGPVRDPRSGPGAASLTRRRPAPILGPVRRKFLLLVGERGHRDRLTCLSHPSSSRPSSRRRS